MLLRRPAPRWLRLPNVPHEDVCDRMDFEPLILLSGRPCAACLSDDRRRPARFSSRRGGLARGFVSRLLLQALASYSQTSRTFRLPRDVECENLFSALE